MRDRPAATGDGSRTLRNYSAGAGLKALDVIAGKAKWSADCADALEWLRLLPDDSVDLLFTSPPYEKARTYSLKKDMPAGQAWVDWMVAIVTAAAPKVKGLIAINCEGQTRNYSYSGVPFLLFADLKRAGFNMRKPPVFHRVGIPGSGGPDWLRNDYEPIVCITRKGKLPWSDNTACGHPPKWAPGGAMAYRLSSGQRVNQWGPVGSENGGGKRFASKAARPSHKNFRHKEDKNTAPGAHARDICAIANPGNVLEINVGGGVLGHALAHESEAPFPLELPAFFVKSFCPPYTCARCHVPLPFSYENKIMQTVRKPVSDGQVEDSILLERMPSEGLRARRSSDEMQSVPSDLLHTRLPVGAKQVLQQGMPAQINGAAEGQVQTLQTADCPNQNQSSRNVLQQDMFEPVDGEASTNDKVSSEDLSRLHPCAPPRASTGDKTRVHHGASAGNGEDDRKTSRKGRSRSPQKQKQVGQSEKKSRTNDQVSTRLPAEAKKSSCVSEVRSHHCANEVCPACGADLLTPNAIVPGIVCDPYAGSFSTIHAAIDAGRRGIGCDIRQSMVDLGERRMATVTQALFAS